MSVMNEQPQRLMRSANRPRLTLQILILDGPPHTVLGELSANLRFALDSGAARQAAEGTGHLRNDMPLGGREETCPHRITCPMLPKALPGLHWRKELTPKTTESHRSGGQREP
jgi:hypothetical protein